MVAAEAPPPGGLAVATAGALRPLLWWPGRRLPAPGRRAGPAAAAARGAAGAARARAPWLVLAHRGDPRLAGAADLLAPLLDEGERERLGRLHRAEDQERFLLGRGLLRLALGAWLGRDPAGLAFRAGAHGKPELVAGPTTKPEGERGPPGAGLQFNLAHAGDLVLLAFHPRWPVGVDVERLRPALAWQRLATRVLSAEACRQLEGLSAEAAPAAFLEHWCRLEARLKARGDGLAGLERLRQEEWSRQGEWHRTSAAAGQASGVGAASAARSGGAGAERLWSVAVPGPYRAAVALARPLS